MKFSAPVGCISSVHPSPSAALWANAAGSLGRHDASTRRHLLTASLLLALSAGNASPEQIVDNVDALVTGAWTSSTLVPGYYGSNYIWAQGGAATATAEFVFQVATAGQYQVSAWWSAPYSTRSPNAPYTIHHAGGTTTVRVDQNANGSQWNELGVFTFAAGEARVVLSNDAQNNPVADAVRLVEVPARRPTSAATPVSGTAPLAVAFQDLSSGTIDTWAWDFGDGEISSQQSPTHQYDSPGVYTVSLQVTGPDGTDTESKPGFITVSEAGGFDLILDNDSATFVGTWSTSTLVPGYYGNNYAWTTGGTGSATAEWVFDLPSDGLCQVMAWWSAPYSTRSPDAPYTIHHAGGSTTVEVNQNANGSQWNDLGTYEFIGGTARVVLSSDAQNNPVADAVRIVYIGAGGTVTADFTASPLSGAAPLTVSFVDQSQGGVSSWQWDFGDGDDEHASEPEPPVHVSGPVHGDPDRDGPGGLGHGDEDGLHRRLAGPGGSGGGLQRDPDERDGASERVLRGRDDGGRGHLAVGLR